MNMVRSNSRESILNRRMFFCIAIMLTVLFSTIFSTPVYAVSEEQAMTNLTVYVYGNMSETDYKLAEGGSIKGKDLFTGDVTKGYDLNEDVFNTLSSAAQTEVVEDIASYSNAAVVDDKAVGVEESTVSVWWKELQTRKGVGSKFMIEILKNTKPDFVTANQIYQPFSGLVGTLMGLGAVLIMALLGLVIVSDIAYITLPPVRIFVNEKREGRGGGSKSLIFTHEAMSAVEIAENSSNGQGEGKQALGIYFKRRVVMLILLGICLMYLVNGSIYVLVGYILDLVSGFLGF